MDQFKTLYNKRGDVVVQRNEITGRYDVLEYDKVVFSDVRHDVAVAAYVPKRRAPLALPEGRVTLEEFVHAMHAAPVEDNSLVTYDELVVLQEAALKKAEADAKQAAVEKAALVERERAESAKILFEFVSVVAADGGDFREA